MVPVALLSACSSNDGGKPADSKTKQEEKKNKDGVEVPGAPADFKLTPAKSKLKLGETANIATEDIKNPDQLLFWKATTTGVRSVAEDPEELKKMLGEDDAKDVKSLACIDVELEFAGKSKDFKGDNYFTPPSFRAAGKNGNSANTLLFGDKALCGIHEADEVPSKVDELQEGSKYKVAEFSYFMNNDTGVDPVGASFEYQLKNEDKLNNQKIYWE